MTERLGQPVVVESKPGAASNISIQATIASPPDGYTLVYVSSSNAINATLLESVPFDYLRDLVEHLHDEGIRDHGMERLLTLVEAREP